MTRYLQSKWFWGAVVLLVVGWWYFIGSQTEPVNADGPGTTIIAFGDSLTQGVGASAGNDYVSVLSRMSGKTIINRGRAGETTEQAMRRLDRDVLQQDPRIVILFLGGNDMLRQVAVETTKANLDSMITQIQDKGAMVVLVGLSGMPLSDYHTPMFRDLAELRGVLLVKNAMGGILTNVKLKSDQVHPNDEGYKIIAKRVYDVLKPYLEEAA